MSVNFPLHFWLVHGIGEGGGMGEMAMEDIIFMYVMPRVHAYHV